MLTIWSYWIPLGIPLLTMYVMVLTNADQPPIEDDFDNWDNGLSW